jgi:hypothetical protein
MSGVSGVGPEQLWAWRAAVMGLDARLAEGALAAAARGGLQDSSPRSALLALHARVEGVGPQAWEDPSLVQVWLRGADYVVPRADAAVFTVGARPRDERAAEALDVLADRVLAVLGGRPRRSGEVAAALSGLQREVELRGVARSGRVHIRWDARTTEMVPADLDAVDAEVCRLELARRFLHWLAPAVPARFARWAGVSRSDATTTFEALDTELATVVVAGERRRMLARDVDDLHSARPTTTVRFLPPDDPYLSRDPRLRVPDAPPLSGPPRVRNSLTGRVLLDGRLVAAFARRQALVSLAPIARLLAEERLRIEEEAATLAGPLNARVDLRWLG